MRQDAGYLAALRTYWKRHQTFPAMAKLCDVVGLYSTSSVFTLVDHPVESGHPSELRAALPQPSASSRVQSSILFAPACRY